MPRINYKKRMSAYEKRVAEEKAFEKEEAERQRFWASDEAKQIMEEMDKPRAPDAFPELE